MFFFVLKCWHHRNEFRSISHVRINWKNSSVIQAGWIWIDRIYTFLWIWFIGSWVIDTFRQWTLKFSRKNALNGCDIARFSLTKRRDISMFAIWNIERNISTMPKLPVCECVLLFTFGSWSWLIEREKTGAASFKYTSFACTFFLSVDDEVGRFWCLTNE